MLTFSVSRLARRKLNLPRLKPGISGVRGEGMDRFRIQGGRPLEGALQISGAKNSALPCMAAALLTPETITLHNLPYVRDIITMRRLLEDLGCTALMPELRTLKINAAKVEAREAPYEL